MKKTVVLAVALLAGFVSLSAPAPARPNFIFILADDLRWDALGCTGHPFAKTPNLDRLAKEGANFRNFFVSIPLCSPSRGSFLTGQYAHTHRVIDNTDHSALSHRLVTFPRLLHDAGYETAYVGKWHMGTDDSPRPGFDHWVSFKGQGVYLDPMINTDGQSARVSGYITDILNARAVDFVRSNHSKPFALYVAHKAVHGPFTPAARHQELYADAVLKPSPGVDDSLEGKPVLTRELEAISAKKSKPGKKAVSEKAPPAARSLPLNQLRALAAIDDGVGQLLAALDAAKQLDDTVFIFTSDNGYFWREHGLGDKRWAYEESIRDPLLIRFPKLIKAGSVFDQLVLNIDIAPTLLELGQAQGPADIQGRSLVPLLKNSKAPWRSAFLTEYFQEKQYPRTPTWQAVRSERWKYIRYEGVQGMDELYDLKADPYELKNLVNQPGAQASLAEMKKELARLRKETGLPAE
jgi:N-acetylglucosamine-6-sulfatase